MTSSLILVIYRRFIMLGIRLTEVQAERLLEAGLTFGSPGGGPRAIRNLL